MIIKLSLIKEMEDDFYYIFDHSNYIKNTKVIKSLIKEKAEELRLKNGDVREVTYFKKSLCHPEVKHYAKGYCRKCYINKK